MNFRFPTDPELRKKWLEVVPVKVSKTSVVCSQHFKPDDFTLGGLLRKKLKPDAVPSIFPVVSDKVCIIIRVPYPK